MMLASEADEAWCPPTFTPSTLSRTWLAWWMVQLASHSTFFSSSRRIASSRALGFVAVPSVMQTNLQRFAAKRNQCSRAARIESGQMREAFAGVAPDFQSGLLRLRRQQDLPAGGGKIGHPQSWFWLRRRRGLGVEDRVGEPIVEVVAAAVVGRRLRLRLAIVAVGRTMEPHVEVIVVAPPRPHLVEPMAVATGVAAQCFLDRRIDEDAGDLGVLRCGLDQVQVRRRPHLRIDIPAIFSDD